VVFFISKTKTRVIVVCILTEHASRRQSSLLMAEVVRGTCPDMCPEKERYMREDRRRLSVYEIVPGTDLVRNIRCL